MTKDRYFDDYQTNMERLEKQQREMREALDQAKLDQYNSTQSPYNVTDYKNITEAQIEYAPQKGQTWLEYYLEIKVHAKNNAKKNIKVHVNGKSGAWHTHSTGDCFMCEDSNLISVLVRVIGHIANKNPQKSF